MLQSLTEWALRGAHSGGMGGLWLSCRRQLRRVRPWVIDVLAIAGR
jgi:hypothetical protein